MKLIRNRILLKAFAAFFLLEILTSTVAPAVSWALTAGPTAPEATSFEPVDTTDMVNLLTGDMVYNMSLLEVPGPAGGYPLSLSYHAGIQPGVEASWVGLGWNVTPGAISRLVNGYADDHNDADVVDHYYNKGTWQTTYSIGVTVPMGNTASVTAGLAFTQSSQYGFSVNPYASGSMEISPGVGIQASSVTGEAQITAPGLDYINMYANRKEIQKNGIDIPVGGKGALGISINSKSLKPKLSVAGFSKSVSREGKVNREEKNASITIPTPYGFAVNLGRNYQRQWVDEEATVKTNGTLYFPQTSPAPEFMNQRSFDVYDLVYEDQKLTPTDPERELGGSYPSYDDYSVNAQGLSGNIRPYHYYGYLNRQNRNNDNDPVSRSVPMGATGNAVGFRFLNDFSNKFLYEPGVPVGKTNGMTMTFAANMQAGKGDEGYANNILAGSKHIEHFTNGEIVNDLQTATRIGFIDCHARGFTRSTNTAQRLGEQIGAFKITNESGVTYHFSLPVYAFDEYTRSEKIVVENGQTIFSEVTRNTPYAYTWMLTAITGPDYVDRSPSGAANGVLDDSDMGYWVDFGYVKWDNDYMWRNPSVGFQQDLDQNFQRYSTGKKELYYLDYVRTASHIAVFDKRARMDGKSTQSAGGYGSSSATTARLDNVFLLNIADFHNLGVQENIFNDMATYRTELFHKAIRSVVLNYDYVLCPWTENSFDPAAATVKQPKLTLNSVEFVGHGGVSMLPPVKFSYEPETPAIASVLLETDGYGNDLNLFRFYSEQADLKQGMIMRFGFNGGTFYGLLTDLNPATHYWKVKIIERTASTNLTNKKVTLTETKNPPYNEDKVDMWGLYKSDFEKGKNGNSKRTTELSAASVDVWSLRGINTMTGSKINIDYEADYYDEVVLGTTDGGSSTQQALRVKNVQKLNTTQLLVTFYDDGYDLNDAFSLNQKADMIVVGGYRYEDVTYTGGTGTPGCNCPSFGKGYHVGYSNSSGTIAAINNSSHTITVSGTGMMDLLMDWELDTQDYSLDCAPGGEPPTCTYTINNRWPSFIAGGVVYSNNKPRYAGGIRVKEIEVLNIGQDKHVQYVYNHGVTSYEPAIVSPFELNMDAYGNLSPTERANEYAEAMSILSWHTYKRYSNLLNIAREVPGPGVMYKNVEVRGSTRKNGVEYEDPTYASYDFQTFTKPMIAYDASPVNSNNEPGVGDILGVHYTNINRAVAEINDLTAAIGNLKDQKTYSGDGTLLTSTHHTYLEDEFFDDPYTLFTGYQAALQNRFEGQGIIMEAYADARVTKAYTNSSFTIKGITSKRRTYPSVAIKQTSKNYKTGIVTESETLGFDFFSGEATRSVNKDGYGNVFVSEVVPAYQKYTDMGLMMHYRENSTVSRRKNMLTQVALQTTYKVNPSSYNENVGLVAASAQTWSDQVAVTQLGTQPGVWRQHRNYTFVGDQTSSQQDGYYPALNVNPFVAWSHNATQLGSWQMNGAITLYDANSRALEGVDMNGIYAATHMSPTPASVNALASAQNAQYNEIGYCGAEDSPYDVAVYSNMELNGVQTGARAHTGGKSSMINTGGHGFTLTSMDPKGRTYRVSVWSSRPNSKLNYNVNSGTTVPLAVVQRGTSTDGAGNIWYLLEAEFNAQESWSNVSVWCEAVGGQTYFDDFRVAPADASMNAYVYDNWGQLTHILDNNNLYTRFKYDAVGRLIFTYQETLGQGGEVPVSQQIYHYAPQ